MTVFYFTKNQKNHFVKVVFLFSILFLIVFAGLRYDTGYDYWSYKEIFDSARTQSILDVSGSEPIFSLIAKIFSFANFNIFLLFIASITLIFRGISLWKYSVYPLIALFIYYSRYFLFLEMGQIRQGLAMAILLFAIPLIINRSFYKFLIVVFFTSMIHSASIFFILAYFISNIKFTRLQYVLIIFLFIPFTTINTTFLIKIVSFLLPKMLVYKLFFYTEFLEKDQSIGLGSAFLLKFSLFIVGLYFLRNIQKSPFNLFCLNSYFVGILFFLFFNQFPQLGVRGSAYFTQVELFLIPLFVSFFKKDLINLLIFISLSLFGFIGLKKIYDPGNRIKYTPYYHIYNNEGMLNKRSLFYLLENKKNDE